ncbi:MAG: peptide chain release factor 3 [Myxococcota bacterium]|nr:peptide chain release factor 3 [Myxococcota bacterium]
MNKNDQIARRRTFAIISHPDAGKTTITEKLLLFGGAIQMAGAIRARRSDRHAASDFLKVEQERGISVSTAVMSFEYLDHAINLLDTPGHADFSEDTYRVLTAVDSSLMVLDNAKGVEQRTRALMDVCRLRDTPVMTFSNKLDREGLDPFELMQDVEDTLKIACAPMTWPIGMGKDFQGVYDLRNQQVVFYQPAKRGRKNERVILEDVYSETLDEWLGAEMADKLREDLELLEALDEFDTEAYQAGVQTPVFFGSAISNFGVKELLDHFVHFAPSPQPRATLQRTVEPTENKFSGFCFKIQANLDKSHHDRMAFVRITSGEYKRGMKLRHVRSEKMMTVNNATTFLARDRVVTQQAFPGDIIGIHNHGGIRIGDTFTEGEILKFTGIPAFAPELFRRVQLLDPLRAKSLVKGLHELSEEGAAQFFRPLEGSDYIIGALGVLQFDVIASRLESEYRVRARFESVPLAAASWVTCDDDVELERFVRENRRRIYTDIAGNYTFIAQSDWAVNYAAEQYPKITFTKTMEV